MDPTRWMDDEKAVFLYAISSFEKEFAKIFRIMTPIIEVITARTDCLVHIIIYT